MQEMCAEALTWGMPYDLFWHGPLNAYFAYRRSAEMKAESQSREMDMEAWRNGQYTHDALLSVYHMLNGMIDSKKAKKFPYPKLPYSETVRKKEAKEKETHRGSPNYKCRVENHNAEIQALLRPQSTPKE